MLAQQQSVAAVQLHIERIFAGGTGVAGAAVIVIVAAALRRVVPVDAGDGAAPGLIAGAGADDHLGALVQHRRIALIHVTLDPEAAGLDDGDQRQGVAPVVGAAVGIDALDLALHLRLDGAVLHVFLYLLDIPALIRDAAVGGADIQIELADLTKGLVSLDIVRDLIQRGLGLLLLLLLVGKRCLQIFQRYLRLLQTDLKLAHVVGKQHVAHLDGVAHFNLDLPDGQGVVLFDICLAHCADHACEPVCQAGGAKPADHGDGLDGCLSVALAAAGRYAQQHDQRQNECSFLHLFISPLLFLCGTPQYLTYFYDGASRKDVPQNKGVSAEKTSFLSYHAPFPQM